MICSNFFFFSNSSGITRLQGKPTMLRPKPKFVPATSGYLIIIALVCNLIFAVRKGVDKMKTNVVSGFREMINNLSDNHNPTPVHYNTDQENPEVTTSNAVAKFSIVTLIFLIPVYYVLFFRNSPMAGWWTEFQYWLIADFTYPFFQNFVYPLILYSQNEKLRKYLMNGFV